MIEWLKNTLSFSRFRHEDSIEREKMARLEAAEREVKELQVRGERAMQYLLPRDSRNHWQEALTKMIQGVP